jgi:hypothetical protein
MTRMLNGSLFNYKTDFLDGFGSDLETGEIEYFCGATVISNKYVLTVQWTIHT